MALTPQEQEERDALRAELAQHEAESAPSAPAASPSDAAVTSLAVTPTGDGVPPSEVQLDASAPPSDEPAPPSWNVAPPTPAPAFLESLRETLVPKATRKEEHEQLPDWLQMPELRHVAGSSALAILGTLASGPEETKKILEKQFPDMKIKQDGRYLLMKSEDGQTYAWKPGLRFSDIGRGVGGAVVAAPAALAAGALAGPGMIGGALAGAGGALTHELLQARAGGNFNLEQVGLAGLLGMIPGAARIGKNLITGAAPEAAAASAASAPEIGATMLKAGRGSAAAAEEAAAQSAPSPAIARAAERQGLTPDVHPDQASTSAAYQQAAQAIPGAAERHAATVDAVRRRVEQLVSSAGGESDRSLLATTIKSDVQNQIEANNKVASDLYDKVSAGVPPATPTPAKGLLAEIDEQLANLKGDLRKPLQKLRDAVAPANGAEPTWQQIDAVRKQLGASQVGRGPFKQLQPGLAKKFYPLLDADQMAAADTLNTGGTFKEAQAAYKSAVAFEDAAAAAYGKEAEHALGRMGSGVKALSVGNSAPFVKIIQAAPEALRPKIAESSLLSIFSKDVDPAWAVKWFDGLRNNSGSYNALMTNLSPATREGLRDAITVLRGVVNASAQQGLKGKAAFPEANGFVRSLLALGAGGATHAAGAALNAHGVPIPTGTVSAFVTMKMLMPKTPALEAVQEFFTSPAGRAALEAAARGDALPSGVARSGVFNRLMDAARVAVPDRERWLERAFTAGAVGSPARAGATQQPEERN